MDMEIKSIDSLLASLRSAASKTAASPTQVDFAAMLKTTLNNVNNAQLDAARQARDFELGAPNANLNDVMLAMQKANLSFQQAVQVRNRLVSAYHDIMNMQV